MRDAGRRPSLVRTVVVVGAVSFWVVQLTLFLAVGMPLPDTILLAVLMVAVPALSVAQLPLIDRDLHLDRVAAYWGSIVTLWLLGATSWLVGTRAGGPAAVGLVGIGAAPLVAWSLALTAGAFLVIGVFRQIAVQTGARESRTFRQLLPRTGGEKRLFVLLSFAAGSCEEIAYRGYAITVLAPVTGAAGAAVLTSAVFGVLHGYQGLLGTLRTGLMGGVLAWGFLASGSLWPAIVAHTLVDLLAGLVLGERLLPPEGPDGVGDGPDATSPGA